jgi:hypothetical protein
MIVKIVAEVDIEMQQNKCNIKINYNRNFWIKKLFRVDEVKKNYIAYTIENKKIE